MVALMLYAYAKGVRSAREIERRCVEDVAMRVIAADLAPDHATIARFRAGHERALGELFGQVLGLCAKAGSGGRGSARAGRDQAARQRVGTGEPRL